MTTQKPMTREAAKVIDREAKKRIREVLQRTSSPVGMTMLEALEVAKQEVRAELGYK